MELKELKEWVRRGNACIETIVEKAQDLRVEVNV
jgi:hypothetical protein